MTRARAPLAFTMIEVFGVLLLIGLLVGILLPAVQSAREMARRTSCSNNMMQVALGVHGYHSAFKQFPMQLTGTDGSTIVGADNDRRLSYLVGVLPFVSQADLADAMDKPRKRKPNETADPYGGMMMSDGAESAASRPQLDSEFWPAGGPEPFVRGYSPWMVDVPVFRCPSDPGIGRPSFGRVNYAACLGDGVLGADSGPFKEVNGKFVYDAQLAEQTDAAMRGIFVPRVATRLSDVIDGQSHTFLLGEMATGLGDSDTRTRPAPGPGAKVLRDNPSWARQTELISLERPQFWESPAMGAKLAALDKRRGFRWADGMPLFTGFNTILPPNREITMRADQEACWGILPPSSRHQSGVNMAMADGSIHFFTDSIEAGDPHAPTVYAGSVHPRGSESPYGLWGALGTRASAELRVHAATDLATEQ